MKIIYADNVTHEKKWPREKYKFDDVISHDTEENKKCIYKQKWHLLFI